MSVAAVVPEMESPSFEARLVATCVELYGPRLRGVFLFGSRLIGTARADSDWDVGVWLTGPIRRRDTWLPWVTAFGDWPTTLDPTFFTQASLDDPPARAAELSVSRLGWPGCRGQRRRLPRTSKVATSSSRR